jgi:phage-related baseplate assembly protein
MSRFPFASLDLSLLPPPQVVAPIDYETIRAARVNDLTARFNAAGVPFDVGALESDPSVIHQEEDAYREMLDRQAINDAAVSVMLAFATDGDLDNLAALLGLRRLTIAAAILTANPPVPAVMESNDDFRARCRIALDATAIGLTGGGYKTIALQAAPEVRSVGLVKSAGGRIDVILLGRGPDGVVADDVVARVNAILQADDGGQLTDIVTVRSCRPKPYDIVVDAIIPPGPAPAPIKAASQAALAAAALRLQTIGGVIPTDALIAAGRTASMTKFALRSPASDIVAAPDEAPYAASIAVNISVSA